NAIDHCEFFGNTSRRIIQRQRVADDRDLDPVGLPGQDGRDEVRRGHQPVCVLVVLVDADAVESYLFCIYKSVDVVVIKPGAAVRVEKLVWAPDPRRVVTLLEIVRQIGPGHQMKEEESHLAPPAWSLA